MEGGPRGRCECREVGREVTPAGPPAPYSEVEETERVVSAGRYGTGTVLIPPFSEYLGWAKNRVLGQCVSGSRSRRIRMFFWASQIRIRIR